MKFFIKTFGCQMNWVDAQRLREYLTAQKLQPVDHCAQADLVIVNLCSVRQSAVEKADQQIKYFHHYSPKAKIILIGCILKRDEERFKKEVDLILSNKILMKKGRFEPALFWQRAQKLLKRSRFAKAEACRDNTLLSQIKKEAKKQRAYLPIMRGCNNFCAYCVVPYTRGREECRPPKEIICKVKHLIKRGAKEIILLGQNVNSYCYKIQSTSQKSKVFDFADLLKNINDLKGDFKIRFLTNHPKDISDKLIDTIARCEKIEKYIHLPVQSGDNKILRKMNRGYTREQYLALVEKIKKKISGVELTTDIIVGFPGETNKQFLNTLDLVKKVGFKTAYIAGYSPRPGTAAFNLKDNVPQEEKKRRHKILLDQMKANQRR